MRLTYWQRFKKWFYTWVADMAYNWLQRSQKIYEEARYRELKAKRIVKKDYQGRKQ